MSTPSPSFRFPFALGPEVAHEEVATAIRYVYNGLLDNAQAIRAIVPKLNANAQAAAAAQSEAAKAATGVASGASSSGRSGSIGGGTNNPPTSSYTLQDSDFGALVFSLTAGDFTVTLNNNVTAPFYCVIENFAGRTVLTPTGGQVNGGASMIIPAGQFTIIFYDAVNWWATTIPPGTLAGVSSSLGGSPLTAGQTIATSLAIVGATTDMVVGVSPQTDPGSGFLWEGFVSAPDTITVRLICAANGTPTASVYNVRVFP